MSEERFDFRWGVPELDAGFTVTPNYVIRHWSEAGCTPEEFALVVCLASFAFNSPRGQASPSVATLATLMGRDVRTVQRMRADLVAKKLLVVIERPGQTSVYSLQPLALKCLALDQAEGAEGGDRTVTPGAPDAGGGDADVRGGVTRVSGGGVTRMSPKEEESKKRNRTKEDPSSLLWEMVLTELRMVTTPAQFAQWLGGSRLLGTEGSRARVEVRDPYCVEWCSTQLYPPIQRALGGVLGIRDVAVEFTAAAA